MAEELAGTATTAAASAPVKEDTAQEIHPVVFFQNGSDQMPVDADFRAVPQKVRTPGGLNPDGTPTGPMSALPSDHPVSAPEAQSAETTATPTGPAPD